jgi:hypothetical protein
VSPKELRSFACKAAKVRPAIAAMLALESLTHRPEDDGGVHRLVVAQTPHEVGEAWAGGRGTPRRGRTSYLAWRLRQGAALEQSATNISGLFIDRWHDMVPTADVDAALAFHTDAPSTTAPNAILLCVPQAGLESWSESLVVEHVIEALELAQVRTVEPGALDALGQFAPLAFVDDGEHQASFSRAVTLETAP